MSRNTSSRFLETDVLERFGCLTIKPGSRPVVATTCGEVALGDPSRCAVTCRRELVEAGFGLRERVGSLIQPGLLEQGSAQHELCVADLAELIWPVPDIIAILSRSIRLKPGDLIMTGTPAGVGAISVGDRVTGGIDSLGTIDITIAPPAGNS